MDNQSSQAGTVEYNSNAIVIVRINRLIDAINDARFRTTKFDENGNVMAEAEEVLSHCICLYKEIMVEILPKDREVLWNKLKTLRDKLRITPPKPTIHKMAYWRKTIDEIDDLDIELRMIAKKKGFLSSNKKDVSKAVLKR